MKLTKFRPPPEILSILLLVGTAFCIFFIKFKSETLSNQLLHENTFQDNAIRRLSLLLNQVMNKIGKLSCKLSDDVSERGGWCSQISGKNSTQHITDVKLAIALSKYLSGKRVASFGDGPGKKKLFLIQNCWIIVILRFLEYLCDIGVIY